jgi:aconitate hydratase
MHTHSFVASPEIVTAMAIAGTLLFNPLTDKLQNKEGDWVQLDPPQGQTFPKAGFEHDKTGFQEPSQERKDREIKVDETSERLQLLSPFPKWEGTELEGLRLLIKARGKCTTDHISMAGPWLKFRGHLDNISNNLLIGAVNDFNGEVNSVKNMITNTVGAVPDTARMYQSEGIGTIVIGDENYGEGSSREHAAMEPRHLGVRVVIVRSFARIHETNLKKQGILAFTFSNKEDYDRILEDDIFDLTGIVSMAPGSIVTLHAKHSDGRSDNILLNHTYNEQQIAWFKAGSALNFIKESLQENN